MPKTFCRDECHNSCVFRDEDSEGGKQAGKCSSLREILILIRPTSLDAVNVSLYSFFGGFVSAVD